MLDECLQAVESLGVTNHIVVALDHAIHEKMKLRRIPVLHKPCGQDAGFIWHRRVDVILEVFTAGFHVVHSDADAVWMKIPLPEYIYDQDYDLIFSPGTCLPEDVHAQWGFVLCCGLYYARSNDITRVFFEEVSENIRFLPDDQIRINRSLCSRGLVWSQKSSYEMEFRGKVIKYYHEPATESADGIRVCILPHAQFQRLRAASNNRYVQHWLSDRHLGVSAEPICSSSQP